MQNHPIAQPTAFTDRHLRIEYAVFSHDGVVTEKNPGVEHAACPHLGLFSDVYVRENRYVPGNLGAGMNCRLSTNAAVMRRGSPKLL
jgi:hypothetical protein